MSDNKSSHSKSKCFDCDNPPTVDILWANGHGRCWFCDEHFEKWKKEKNDMSSTGTNEGDICKVRKVKDGEVPEKWSAWNKKLTSSADVGCITPKVFATKKKKTLTDLTDKIISLETVLKSLPPVIFIGGNSGYLTGELVTNGKITKDKNIEITIVGKPNTRVITAFKRIKPEWLADRIHITFTDVLATSGSMLPIFKKGVFKTSGVEQERHEEHKEESIMKLKSLKSMNSYQKNEFSDYNRFYMIWGSKYLSNGIFVSKLYNGRRFGLYKEGDKISIINASNQMDMSDVLPNVTKELRRIKHDFIIYAEAICYDCKGKQVESAELKEISCDIVPTVGTKIIPTDKVSPEQEAGLVFHVYDIIYLDGHSLTKERYEDRLNKLQNIMSYKHQYIGVVKSSNKVMNPHELTKWTNELRQIKNSRGVSYRTNDFVYLARSGNKSNLLAKLKSPKTEELPELSINLTTCPYYKDEICLLNKQPESLSFPISCSLADIHKCYYLKEEYYGGNNNEDRESHD